MPSDLTNFDFDDFLNSSGRPRRGRGGGLSHFNSGITRSRMRLNRESEQEPEDSVSSSNSSDDSSDSAASSMDEKKKKSKKDKTKADKRKRGRRSGNDRSKDGLDQLAALLGAMKPKNTASNDTLLSDPLALPAGDPLAAPALNASDIAQQVVQLMKQEENAGRKSKPGKVGSKVAFKRVDQVYDRKIHNYKLKETVHDDPKRDEWDQVGLFQHIYHVR